jgi:hypothetical protein
VIGSRHARPTPPLPPTPWHADKIAGGYVVRDANGQALAYLYSRENEAEASPARAGHATRMTVDDPPLGSGFSERAMRFRPSALAR